MVRASPGGSPRKDSRLGAKVQRGTRTSAAASARIKATATRGKATAVRIRQGTAVNDAVDSEQAVSALWSVTAADHGWEPQRTKALRQAHAADCPFDRYDVAGTADINELVLKHGTMATSDLKTTRRPVLYHRLAGKHACSSSPFLLDRYLSNLVRALVHPLHNFLQCHHSLHNADEVQVMLMPREGPIAEADRRSHPFASPANGTAARRCYIATNNETLTEGSLQAAVADWGVAGVFQISEFKLVTGEKGRHAEQKLLEHLQTEILPRGTTPAPPTADQKALIVGERLPCVVCRLFAVAYESVAVLLPSHGHLYLSTLHAAAESRAAHNVKDVLASPGAAAALLLAPPHRRVLR
ncbi:OTT_1508-like deaminase [Novymonas esmeraldas]|uniref:OTT_1508-like deaminase n=1 Tax=Novymonas esmeraldas TaxID=1808958 RepID=A0AAW0FBL2_9TRYP